MPEAPPGDYARIISASAHRRARTRDRSPAREDTASDPNEMARDADSDTVGGAGGADGTAPTMKDAIANTGAASDNATGATEPTGANGANGTAGVDGSGSNKGGADKSKSNASNGGGSGGGSGGSGSSARDAAHGDGTLSVTPDSPADSEWRQRRGPLDAAEGGPWASEDAAGACE